MEKSGALLMVFLGLLVTVSQTVVASDPDLTTDFNVTNPNASDFTFTFNVTEQASGMATPFFAAFNVPPTFPGLNGLGLTAALFEFGPNSQIDPHTHPRGTELFYVLTGIVEVGFVDTTNTLFEATVTANQLFIFPKGLLHFQRNNQNSAASGYSVINSENPGTLLIAKALFNASGTGLPDNVLESAFGTSPNTIDAIKKSVSAGASGTPPSPSPWGY